VADAEDAMFAVGSGWRKREVAKDKLTLAVRGEWLFTDDDAAGMAGEVYLAYKKLFGGEPDPAMQVIISHFPVSTPPGNWEAETRGNTVLILSSDMPFAAQSKQRLHEQLRHEMFHLWLPNAVDLKGNYDWFYEGFAMYQSLKLAVSLNRIRFDDYLDTLSRARYIAEASPKRRSLVEASKNRFLGSETELYARGMATAFLCDLAMLDASGGKRSVETILRTLFQKFRNTQADGSDAALAVMNEFAELRPIVEKHITGVEKIDWPANLAKAGIEQRPDGTVISVMAKPNKRQRAMLDELGYNNWRNLSSPTR
jgi:predicted metalloprotease with PDZ domain